jgi:acetyl-CoA synthetase
MTIDHYRRLHEAFRWHVPRHFNLAVVCAERWANARHGDRCAIIETGAGARPAPWTYRELHRDACRLANALDALGVERGDRVAIILPQCGETAIAHLAAHRLGAISMPLSVLFGPEALTQRLQDAGARIAIVDAANLESFQPVISQCPQLTDLITIGAHGTRQNTVLRQRGRPRSALAAQEMKDPGAFRPDLEWRTAEHCLEHDWHALLDRASNQHRLALTLADDAAILLYTSGTTGPPKGALVPHRALLGNLSGFVASQDWFPWKGNYDGPPRHHRSATVRAKGIGRPDRAKGDIFWSPADWAWTGGLWDALLPTLYFGRPIVGSRERFDAGNAFDLMARHQVTNAFVFPTVLKLMMKTWGQPSTSERRTLELRALMSAGESLGASVFNWCTDALGFQPNEMFGQTEANYVVGNSSRRWPAAPGCIGRPYPGHRVAIVNEEGREVPAGVTGEIAVHRSDRHGHPDPVLFLGYWRNAEATQTKFRSDWWLTGDLGTLSDHGDIHYQGRADDLFKSSGYRIGPGEIENCLVAHPAVSNAAVVPKPDAIRGAVVKAYVVLAPDQTPSAQLIEALQTHVRDRLAPYEYPKEIEFIDALPMTTTGKVQRRILRLQEEARAEQLSRQAPPVSTRP